ncbi:MAG: hypothetical protein AAGG65_18550 [Pseudomonadota bacterium]
MLEARQAETPEPSFILILIFAYYFIVFNSLYFISSPGRIFQPLGASVPTPGEAVAERKSRPDTDFNTVGPAISLPLRPRTVSTGRRLSGP